MKFNSRASEWQVTTDYQCLTNLAADCTFYISFCQPGWLFNYDTCCNN